jgi:hypothetical protein
MEWGSKTKFGFCRASRSWVPRDEMMSINVRVYDAENNEVRIPVRLSADEHWKLVDMLEELRWDNQLETTESLKDRGLEPCKTLPVFQPDS